VFRGSGNYVGQELADTLSSPPFHVAPSALERGKVSQVLAAAEKHRQRFLLTRDSRREPSKGFESSQIELASS
jgi:hypothetical protein